MNLPLLGAYWAKTCPTKVRNVYDQSLSQPEDFTVPETAAALMAAGIAFEETVFAELADQLGADFVDVTNAGPDRADLIAATVAQTEIGSLVIAGGALPDDPATGRQGKPDLLVRATDPGASRHRYHPVDVKDHRTWTDAPDTKVPAVLSLTTNPQYSAAFAHTEAKARHRQDDAMQLAHYHLMLEACGRQAEGLPLGGILGRDRFEGELAIVWTDLTEPRYRTWAATADRGYRDRSALDRDTYEHDLRIRIALDAKAGNHAVQPIYSTECDSCVWLEVCADQVGPDDASMSVATLGKREWMLLRGLGYGSLESVAELDLSDAETARQLDEAYFPHVRHVSGAAGRLRKAITRAQLARDGVDFRRKDSRTIDVPRGALEIDFDIETDRNGLAYLWGLLISVPATGQSWYEYEASWEPLDEFAEAALAMRFWRRLNAHLKSTSSTKVYHYSHPEPARLRRIARAGTLPADKVEAVISDHFVDLLPVMRRHFDARAGYGLKQVAVAAGFEWRDEDPGGLQSQVWLDQGQDTTDPDHLAARERILRYNEDDVLATLAVRDWLVDQ